MKHKLKLILAFVLIAFASGGCVSNAPTLAQNKATFYAETIQQAATELNHCFNDVDADIASPSLQNVIWSG